MQWQRPYIYLFYYMRVSLGLIQCIRDWPCQPGDLPNVFYRVQAEKLSHCQTGTQRVMRTHFLQPFHFHVDGSFISLALICLLSANASSNREQIYSMQIKLTESEWEYGWRRTVSRPWCATSVPTVVKQQSGVLEDLKERQHSKHLKPSQTKGERGC